MKKVFFKMKKYIFSTLAVALFIFAGAFVSMLGMNSPVEAKAFQHNCYMLSEPVEIGQTEVDYLMANLDTPENVGLVPSATPYEFYLGEDVSWEGEFVAPEGVMIAICLNGHTANGTIDNDSTTGGLYFIQCAVHSCGYTGGTFIGVQQSFFDGMAKAYGGVLNLGSMEVALTEDVVLSDEWVLAEGSSLSICTNGYTLTGGENMGANGGEFTVFDCTSLHNCYYFGTDGVAVNQQMVDLLLSAPRTAEAWGMSADSEYIPAYLTENVSWEGDFVVPDGVKIALCLNGYTINGNINNEATTGHIYVMQCGVHNCEALSETMLSFSAGYVELLEDVMYAAGQTADFESGAYIALAEDITLRYPEVWAAPAGGCITICTCGYTLTNVDFMRANGAGVNLVACQGDASHNCQELNGETAEFFTQKSLSFKTDANGVLLGDSEQTLCLLGNVTLAKPLIIPTGMNVKLCLNGFTLKSPPMVSPDQTTNGKEECLTTIEIMPGASLTVCDCSESETGCIMVDFENMLGFGAIFSASAIYNEGSFTLNSGSLVGAAPLLNASQAVINDGKIIGLVFAVVQGYDIMGGMEIATYPSLVMNGGEIHSAALGIIADDGDIIINDGEINAQYVGVSTSINFEAPTGDSLLYLNGGVINVGQVEAKTYRTAGFPVEDGSDLGVGSDICVGVVVCNALVLGDDVVINLEGPKAESANYIAEIFMADGAILMAGEDATIENIYQVSVKLDDQTAIVDPSLAGNVVPATDSIATLGDNGELIIKKNDGSFVPTARVYGYSVSLKGSIQVNCYVEADEEFVNNPDARVILMYRGEKFEYKLSDAKQQAGYYIFNINVSAKDYQKYIHCSFSDGTNVWYGHSSTVNKYLSALIEQESAKQTYALRSKSALEVALTLQNYCMAASYHFDITEEYTATPEIAEIMAEITAEDVVDYAATQSGKSDRLQLVGASLFLQSETTIRFYFRLKNGASLSELNLTVDGKAVQAYKDGSAYYIEITNIKAQELSKMMEINLDGHVINYCALSYAYSILKTSTTEESLVNVAKSLVIYYVAAYNYFN